MSLTILTLVPLLLLVGWLAAEFRGRTWVRVVTGFAALVAIAVMAFLWGRFMEAFKHTEFPLPHDSPAHSALMDTADQGATNNVTK